MTHAKNMGQWLPKNWLDVMNGGLSVLKKYEKVSNWPPELHLSNIVNQELYSLKIALYWPWYCSFLQHERGDIGMLNRV